MTFNQDFWNGAQLDPIQIMFTYQNSLSQDKNILFSLTDAR